MRLPNVQLDMRAERLEGPDSCVCVSEMTMRGEADVCRRELEKRDAHMRPDFPITLWHTEDPADYIIKLSYEHHFSTAPKRACERSRLILHFVGMRSVAHSQSKRSANVLLTLTDQPNPAQITLSHYYNFVPVYNETIE